MEKEGKEEIEENWMKNVRKENRKIDRGEEIHRIEEIDRREEIEEKR